MRNFSLRGVALAGVMAALSMSASKALALSNATTYGPTPYLSFDDSPFKGMSFSQFHLEDFEDHALNTPGVTGGGGGVTSAVYGPGSHDSVDADDGAIDGLGLAGDSWFTPNGATGVSFTFDAGVLGALPDHVGIVWTDGAGDVLFKAFGPGDVLLATIGPVGGFADYSFLGTTAEDRFFGVANTAGIAKIWISNSVSGMEVDHLQYGIAGEVAPSPIPLPAGWAMGLTTMAGLGLGGWLKSRRALA